MKYLYPVFDYCVVSFIVILIRVIFPAVTFLPAFIFNHPNCVNNQACFQLTPPLKLTLLNRLLGLLKADLELWRNLEKKVYQRN